jgi:hypothetical protein
MGYESCFVPGLLFREGYFKSNNYESFALNAVIFAIKIAHHLCAILRTLILILRAEISIL